MGPRTVAGKSSSSLIMIIRQNENAILPDDYTPIALVPEGMTVRGARRWLDSGRPDGTAIDYPTWVK